MRRPHDNPRRVDTVTSRNQVSIEFGYILDMATQEDTQYYIALVARESSVLPAESTASPLMLAHTFEEVTTLYGSPEDLIGRRVRIEYFGSDWRKGVAYITAGRVAAPLGTAMEVPSRGFRYAVAGGGSV